MDRVGISRTYIDSSRAMFIHITQQEIHCSLLLSQGFGIQLTEWLALSKSRHTTNLSLGQEEELLLYSLTLQPLFIYLVLEAILGTMNGYRTCFSITNFFSCISLEFQKSDTLHLFQDSSLQFSMSHSFNTNTHN